jgi:Mg-chelatase subunit ChlD
MMPPTSSDERLHRWRLILGATEADGLRLELSEAEQDIDRALAALYNAGLGGSLADTNNARRGGNLADSAPHVARWLGDIRRYFPASVVRVMQQDALARLGLRAMLLQPELLQAVVPDVHLVATLLSLKKALPAQTRDTARQVVRRVVAEVERRLAAPLRQAVRGSLNRAILNRRPRAHEIHWPRTIRANLKHYQPAYRTILPVTRLGSGRQRRAQRDLILCVDQSGSMATSVVYAGIFGAVLASLSTVRTHMVVFDTAVVDLTAQLHDPVELLFGTQLGGGTDIHQALTYCQHLVQQPQDTILVLISDLYEGGDQDALLHRVARLVASGVQMIALLALSDDGAPSFDHAIAEALAAWGIPAFACTPDQFPALMAAAIMRQDIGQWAATQGIVTTRGAMP